MSDQYAWGPGDRMDCSPFLPDRSSAKELQDAADELRWAESNRTWRDAMRCLIGRHRAVVTVRHGLLFQRCSCGAKRLGPYRPWFEGDPLGRRRRAVDKAIERAVKQIKEAN